MSDHSAIEWCDATWPIVAGCDYVSPGCANCYAVRDARRLGGNPHPKIRAAYAGVADRVGEKLRWTGLVRTLPERLDWPLKWRKPRRIFVCNESDLFHPDVPASFILEALAVMERCPQHTFQILTKRPERMFDVLGGASGAGLSAPPLPNVWLGVSVENQRFADQRIPLLLQTPAAVRFISAEPLLGPIAVQAFLPWKFDTFPQHIDRHGHGQPARLDWVIVGGESGPKSRPFDLTWARSIVAQCQAAGVACFVKQLGASPVVSTRTEVLEFALHDRKGGAMAEWPRDLRVREFPAVAP